ncbi:MAG TPA: hypothetical protein ENK18_02615 [Deltaproteobacteria bacterium]|nr:hypothetical protein [Deltaproteobacteria bacterium]
MEDLPELLTALASEQTRARTAKNLRCIRGIRGVPQGEIARIAAELWRSDPPQLPRDGPELAAAFGAAWEDGLIAIALLATALADDPPLALQIGLDWAERTDDLLTADALGWLILAPCALLSSCEDEILARLEPCRPEARRAAIAMGLGLLPLPVEGPAAAGLRAKHGIRHVQIVDHARSDRLAPLCSHLARDPAPAIQKGLRRVLRAWGAHDPGALVRWAAEVKGGLPRMLSDEVRRTSRRHAGSP